jgi:hypothetical protein
MIYDCCVLPVKRPEAAATMMEPLLTSEPLTSAINFANSGRDNPPEKDPPPKSRSEKSLPIHVRLSANPTMKRILNS